ncbi:MAG: O-antigen polysaccharide polymerase Wzy family protein [Coriobacteriales bacterium]|jgi:oligosaccharide repeat unit polymerase|nr:O-antigen polysaccharide polymerase Wzy family protein [Coriobacteriales bacterium]
MTVLKTAHSVFFPLPLLLFITGIQYGDLTLALIAVIAQFVLNVLYAIERLSRRSVFLYFHLAIALFLVFRPTFDLLTGVQWMPDARAGAQFCVTALFITLFLLRLGSMVAEWRQGLVDQRAPLAAPAGQQTLARTQALYALRVAAGIVFVIGFLGLLWLGITKLGYMAGKGYVDYYLISVDENTNIVQRTLATMEPYALCAFLATFPGKKASTVALGLNVVTAIPMLIIGSRGDFVYSALFFILYYVLREVTDGKGTWIGTLEKTVAAIVIPVGIIAMGLVSYIRSNVQVGDATVVDSLIKALYSQGVSFDILSRGFNVDGRIEMLGSKNYTFGGLIDYFVQGPIGHYLFGFTDYGSVNSVQVAVNSNSYSHAMSYFAHPNYLGGEGYGSSYLLELYADYGYVGIGVFSLLFGGLLGYLPRLLKRSWMWGTLALIIILQIFPMPRSSVLDGFHFLYTLQFWFTIAIIWIGAKLLGADALRATVLRSHRPHKPRVLTRGSAALQPSLSCALDAQLPVRTLPLLTVYRRRTQQS